MEHPENIHAHAQSKDVHEEQTAHPGSNINRISIRLDANALAITSLVLSAAAFVIVIALALMQPQATDAKIQAGMAEVRGGVQQQIADVKATAQAGKEHARIALDEVQRSNAQLEAKGLLRPANH